MSAAEVGLGGPPAPHGGTPRLTALSAWARALGSRLRARAAHLTGPDESVIAAWAAALAAAPQAVPNLPRPANTRLARLILGLVIGAHAALLIALWWRSAPPPPPQNETTVELVRAMPEPPKPAPPKPKPASKPEPTQPGDPKAQADGRKSHPASKPQVPAKPEDKPKPTEKPKTEQAKPEPKHEAPHEMRQAKATHQRPQHAPPPRETPAQQRTAPVQPAQERAQEQAAAKPSQPQPQVQPEKPIAMPAVALPGASAFGTEVVAYPQLVLSQVAKAKKQGRYMGVPGYAGVRFRVAEDGSLESVRLVVSSGDPTLDIEAEAMIRRAAPFPPPPPGARRDYGITLVFAAQPK